MKLNFLTRIDWGKLNVSKTFNENDWLNMLNDAKKEKTDSLLVFIKSLTSIYKFIKTAVDKIQKRDFHLKRIYYLASFSEEAGEVMDLLYLDSKNKDEIEHEINDIIAVAEILVREEYIHFNFNLDRSRKIINISDKQLFTELKNIHYFSSKAIRFGLLDTKPKSDITNKEQIESCMNNLLAIVAQRPELKIWRMEEREYKRNKVDMFFEYSKHQYEGKK